MAMEARSRWSSMLLSDPEISSKCSIHTFPTVTQSHQDEFQNLIERHLRIQLFGVEEIFSLHTLEKEGPGLPCSTVLFRVDHEAQN